MKHTDVIIQRKQNQTNPFAIWSLDDISPIMMKFILLKFA